MSNDPTDLRTLRGGDGAAELVRRHYDEWAETYNADLGDWSYQAPRVAAELLRAEGLDPGAHLLDAGCGTGMTGAALADVGFRHIDGIDFSEQSIAVAAETGVYGDLRPVDLQELPLPFDDSVFDAVTCIGVLTYIPTPRDLLAEFARVTRPGGTIVVSQRDDVWVDVAFDDVLSELESAEYFSAVKISEPQPYLPSNDDFADDVRVVYVVATAGGSEADIHS